MAKNRVEMNQEIANRNAAISTLIASVLALITAMTAAFNALHMKIEAGSDFQPEVDKINELNQALADVQTKVEVATAEAQIEGQ